jgi:hypothetical protein
VLNDAVTSATLSPAEPGPGQSFSVTGYQTLVNLPAALASAAASVGGASLVGAATTQIDAGGATPATTAEGPINFSVPFPSPIPASGVALSLPSTPATVSGFTATGGTVTIQEDSSASLTIIVANTPLTLTCTAYPNDSVTPSGIATGAPTVPSIAPVIAVADGTVTTTTTSAPGTTTTTAPATVITGAYELFCPATPVGNVVLNDAVTSASLSPPDPSPGQSFSLTGYQTVVNLPSALASAAAALSPDLEGTASTQIDATGASPATTPIPGITFGVPIPTPVPSGGVPLSLPATPATVTGFTATSFPITIQEDAETSLTLTVAGSGLTLTCTAYPNDSITPSGITTTAQSEPPIAPVLAVSEAGPPETSTTITTTASTTTTTLSPTSTTTASSTTTTGPPKSTTTTTGAGGGGTSGASTTTPGAVRTASSGALAFTGPGRGITSVALVGIALMVLGLVLLMLVDIPRRALRGLVSAGARRSSAPRAGRFRNLAATGRRSQRFGRWLFGRGDG